jgi:hypothetical protein
MVLFLFYIYSINFQYFIIYQILWMLIKEYDIFGFIIGLLNLHTNKALDIKYVLPYLIY